MEDERTGSPPLWQLVEAGGCARKLPAADLRALAPWLESQGQRFMEDAAVVTLGGQRVVQTVDFITPLVPDPGDFGRVAAANALSDIFVTGARPVSALAVACVPLGDSVHAFAEALAAARAYLATEGCGLVGGHSIADSEPKLGFAVIGIPGVSGRLLGSEAKPGDGLVLTKPIGVGLIASGYKAGLATTEEMTGAVVVMTRSNSCVPQLMDAPPFSALHGATDISGFGLLAHVGELCRRSGLGAALKMDAIPLISGARRLAEAGVRTSAHRTNIDYVLRTLAGDISSLSEADVALLADPQTSGGALLAVDPDSVDEVVHLLDEWGVSGDVIGRITNDPLLVAT